MNGLWVPPTPDQGSQLSEWGQDCCPVRGIRNRVRVLWGSIHSPNVGMGMALESFCLLVGRGQEQVTRGVRGRISDLEVLGEFL